MDLEQLTNAPRPPPLPRIVGDHEAVTETQWQRIFFLIDATVPSIAVEEAITDNRKQLRIARKQLQERYDQIEKLTPQPPGIEKFEEYLRQRLIDDPRYRRNVQRLIMNLPVDLRKKLTRVMDVLGTIMGSYFLTGYCTPLEHLPVHQREAIMKGWNESWLPGLPLLARVFRNLAQLAFSQSNSLYLDLIGYKNAPPNYKAAQDFEFKFMKFDAGHDTHIIETDVLIVGSGCGGGVCAKVLAEAGHNALVVDKGYYFPPSQLPMGQEAGANYLFENSGIVSSDDSGVFILAGSCWGGGGTVNWSVSMQPQNFVREEWADEGMELFVSNEFQASLDRVCEFMGVTRARRHNHGARVILEGAQKLGWKADDCPQNTGADDHYCGRCHLGCGSSGKKGPAVSWLPAAARAGAKFIEGFSVSEIVFEEFMGSKTATGVVGTWTSRNKDGQIHSDISTRTQRSLRVMAKRVIIAAGSLQSPVILMKSGLKNYHIGRHLHLHPCNYVVGRFDQDIQPWEGSSITSVCTKFENLDGKGHGVKLETLNMVPYLTMSNMPWFSALEFKLNALKFRNMNGFIALTRDRDTGRVYPDPISGKPRIIYVPSSFDRAHSLAGVIALAKLCYVQGAQELIAFLPGTRPFVRDPSLKTVPDVSDPDFTAWLATLQRAGNPPLVTPFGSAHQMGSCRMSSRENDGVVDTAGKVWGVNHLYVADSSTMPSASGVNPMVTTMGIADWIAHGIAKDLSCPPEKS